MDEARRRFLRFGAAAAVALGASACDHPAARHLVAVTRPAEGPDGREPFGGDVVSTPEVEVEAVTLTPTPATPRPAPVDPAEVAARYEGRKPVAWGLDLEGIQRQLADPGTLVSPRLALTFDCCGSDKGRGVDTALIDLLEREGVGATFFLCLRWTDANPAATDRLAANPRFAIGNHGTRHQPLSVTGRSAYGIAGTRSALEAATEVAVNQERLTSRLGAAPRWFRSGTAFYDDIGLAIVRDLGLRPVGFAVNGDNGATSSASQVRRALETAPPGAIVIGHANHPGSGTAAGVAAALAPLRSRGTRLVSLAD